MNEEQMQDPQQAQGELGDSKASLAFSNMLREQMFMQENPPMEEGMGEEMPMEGEMGTEEAPVEPQEALEQEETTEPEEPEEEDKSLAEMENRITQKIEELGKTLKDDQIKAMDKEMTEIKKTLKDLSA